MYDMWHPELRRVLCAIDTKLDALDNKMEKHMTQSQADVDSATAFDVQLDTDLNALKTQVTSGQAALDAAIAALKVASPAVDTSKLVAAQLVLAGDQPNLDAAVAALTADPNIAPAPVTPAPSA
jgi:hypothetical protein